VIYKLRELRGVEELGGTMRLGAWTCKIEPDTLAYKIYGKLEISERHRHRYEFNREYEETLTAGGLRISGSTPDGTYVEMWSCLIIPILSVASSIPNSNRSHWNRTRCLRHSSGRLTSTGSSGGRRRRRPKWRCSTAPRRLEKDS
jgi:hypothetical protein